MRKTWKDVPGKTVVDPYCELELHWRSSGWREPAQLCGPPEKCTPEDSEEWRVLEYAVLDLGDVRVKVADQPTLDLLEATYEDDIYKGEVEVE